MLTILLWRRGGGVPAGVIPVGVITSITGFLVGFGGFVQVRVQVGVGVGVDNGVPQISYICVLFIAWLP